MLARAYGGRVVGRACGRDGPGQGQVLSGGMGSEEDEHVVMCCFCPLLCPVLISCYLLRLLITINAHFPFYFIPSLQLLKFLWNKRDDRLPIFQSANFLSPQVVSQIDAHRQCQLKLVGVFIFQQFKKRLDSFRLRPPKTKLDNGSRAQRRHRLDRFNVISGISLRFESVSEVEPFARNEERHHCGNGRMPAPFRRRFYLHRRNE